MRCSDPAAGAGEGGGRVLRAARAVWAARAARAVRAARSMRGGSIGAGIGAAWLRLAADVLATSPSPSAAPVGDPRSSGQGPGLVGDPLLAIAVVAAIGMASLVATRLYVRATRDPRGS